MPPENAVRFRVDPQMRRQLDRLRREKAVNISAWVRRLVRKALDDEFPDEELDPNKPLIAGWTPRQLDQGWGAVLEGAQVADLPAERPAARHADPRHRPTGRRLDHDSHGRCQ